MFNPGTFLVLIIILIYIAFSLKSTAVMLLVFVMSVFYVISVISTVLRCREIRGHMHVPIEISEKGRENLVKISVINQGKRMIFRTKALIVVKDITRGKRKQYWKKLPVLHEGENEFVESIIFHEMGKYELQLKCLRIYDITGLMHVDIRIKDTGKLRVMPGMYEVSVVRTEATKNFYGEADTYDEWFPGYDNNEIFQLREYQRGDRLQNVHWKLTAKHEELIIKEHSLPRSCPVVLLLDYQSWGFWGRRFKVIPFMEATAGISFSIMDAGCPHYIAWYDKNEKDIVRIRVDDEESLFYFVGILADIRWGRCKRNLQEKYKEKYRVETYVREFVLNEKLELKDDKGIIAKMSAHKLEKTLSEVELVL